MEGKAQKEGFSNINTILSDGDTGLPNESVDVILLYGVLLEIENKESLLRELCRILKPDGYLSTRFYFRMKKDEVLQIMQVTGLFILTEQRGHILNFAKIAKLADTKMV
jgi:ubiquinone/menaquinone biosynthesis C-methylase UbiE